MIAAANVMQQFMFPSLVFRRKKQRASFFLLFDCMLPRAQLLMQPPIGRLKIVPTSRDFMTSAAPAQICGANRLKFVRLRSPPCLRGSLPGLRLNRAAKGTHVRKCKCGKAPSRAPASLTLTLRLK